MITEFEHQQKKFPNHLSTDQLDYLHHKDNIEGRMYSLGEMNFIQGMLDLGNCKNSVGLKPNAELRKDAKAPSIPKS